VRALLVYILRKSFRDRGLLLLCVFPAFVITSALAGLMVEPALRGKSPLPLRIGLLTASESITLLLTSSFCLQVLSAAAAAFLAFRRDVAIHAFPLWMLASSSPVEIWLAAAAFGLIVGFASHAIATAVLMLIAPLNVAIITTLIGRLALGALSAASFGVALSLSMPNGGGLMNALLLTGVTIPFLLLLAPAQAAALTGAIVIVSIVLSTRLMVRRCAQ
jgi:hypothetical protein